MHLIVFDVDGTLVQSEEFDWKLYVQAIQTVLEIDIDDDWSGYRHVTDSGILQEIIENADRNKSHPNPFTRVKETFVRMMAHHLDDRGGRLSEVAGARAFVETLRSRPEVSVAIATGGWRETAMMKLRGIGLNPKEICLASASDAVSRVEIMRVAEQRALQGMRAERRTYFGDRSWDLKACQELGFDFIAIGNNVSHPKRYPDFRDAEAILEELGLHFSKNS